MLIEVCRYADGASFLDEYKGNCQIIFMDIVMPHMDGLEAAKRLRERQPPFISTLDIPACSQSVRHTVGEEHRQLRMDHAPVLPPASPFLRNIRHGQI